MKEKILSYIAWTLLAVGVSCADSERLFVPGLITGLGALLLYKVSH